MTIADVNLFKIAVFIRTYVHASYYGLKKGPLELAISGSVKLIRITDSHLLQVSAPKKLVLIRMGK